jgi:ABC-2 type transport system permease protein
MRALGEIFRFEIRFQARSVLFIALLGCMTFIHFCAARKWGIDIGVGAARDAASLELNSAVAVVQNELALSLFSVFPALALAATAITRDHEHGTAELFYTRPFRPASFFAGRFGGALVLALLVSVAGVLASLVSLLAPGVEAWRLMPFRAAPWLYTLNVIVIPNTIIVATLIFAAAAWARSITAAYCVALILPLIPIMGMVYGRQSGFGWFAYADPFGAAALDSVTRFWSRQELVSQLPGGVVLLNRILWLAISGVVLALSVARFRFSLDKKGWGWPYQPKPATGVAPVLPCIRAVTRFGGVATLPQFVSQLCMDLRAILLSPSFPIVLFLIVGACFGEYDAPSPMIYNQPQLPLTSRFIAFFEPGIGMQVILAIGYYAGVLVHRERQYSLAEIADASPVSTGSVVLSKIAALVIMVILMQLAAVATFACLQLAQGYTPIEPGLYLRGMIVYGFNHYAIIVPAVFIQILFPNRWLGMLAFFVVLAVNYSLPALGYENILYNFRVVPPPYSDMNGFGHFVVRQLSVAAYWATFLGILTVASIAFARRGYHDRLRLRLADAWARMTISMQLAAAAFLLLFGALGGWIYYNTHLLNPYVAGHDVEVAAAAYEKKYKRFAGLWSPVTTDVDMKVDFFPSQRRVESRGTMRLMNDSNAPLLELLVTLNPALTVDALDISGTVLIERDDRLAVRRFRLAEPLQPGAAITATWNFTWRNQGFVNSVSSNAVVENGSNVEASDVMPVFGYNSVRELDDPSSRIRLGLPPVTPLASLDDATARNDKRNRFAATHFRAVVGTSADQTALTSGTLKRAWQADERRYFEYDGYFPIYLAFASARYAKLHGKVDGVALQVFYDRRHRAAATAIMNTMKRGLAYYNSQFTPYFADTFKVFEYPGYSTRAHAMMGMVSYTESAGFTRRFKPGQIDIATAHELGHMWWGGQVRSPHVQGQEVLNEGLASYAAFMLIEHEQGRAAVQPYLDFTRDQYLDAYSRVVPMARPVIRAEMSLDTYGKASLVMYTLRDVLGAEVVNGALRSFLIKYGNRPPPFPTTRELITELRAVAGDQYQPLITDLFERITFYDIAVDEASVRRVADSYEVTVTVKGRKIYADEAGREADATLLAPFDVAVYGVQRSEPLYMTKHWLITGEQRITLRVKALPARVVIDPRGMMLDRRTDDNALNL